MIYKIQIDDTVREATDDEAARIDAFRNDIAKLQAAKQSQDAAAVSARAKLAALGLTEAEIKALVG
jgi:hypothetical protein